MKLFPRLILAFLFIALLVALLGLLAVHFSQKALEKSIGEHAAYAAQAILEGTENQIFRQAEGFRELALSSPGRALLADANRRFQTGFADDRARTLEIARRDEAWTRTPPEANRAMEALAALPLSALFREKMAYLESRAGYPVAGEVFLTNRYGVNAAQSGPTSDYYQGDEAWWREAKERGIHVGELSFDESAGVFSLSVSFRIDDEEGFAGVLKTVIDARVVARTLDRAVARLREGGGHRTAHFKLVSREGAVLYTTMKEHPLRTLPPYLAAALEARPGPSGYFIAKGDENRGEEIYAFARSASPYRPQWTLFLEHKREESFARVRELFFSSLLLFAAALGAALVFAYLIARFFTRPLVRLEEGARAIGRGELELSIPRSGSPEFDALADALESTARRLGETTVSRDRLQNFLDVAGVMIVVLDKEGKIALVNEKACRTLGRTREELLGQDWFDACLPERVRPEVRQVFARIMAGELEPLEYYQSLVVAANGEERQVSWHNALYYDRQGKVAGVLSSGEDVTELRRIKERLEEAQRIAKMGNIVWDVPENTVWWSDEIFQIFAMEKRERGLGYEEFMAFVHPDDRAKVELAAQEALTDRKPYNVDFRLVLEDGTEKFIHEEAETAFDDRGNPVRMVGTIQDITQLARTRRELEAYKDRLEERVKEEIEKRREQERMLVQQSKLAAMGEMIGNIAHQWRQPINGIGLLIQDLEEAYDFGELDKAYLTTTVEQTMSLVNQMSDTINDFRNFFSPSKQKAPFTGKQGVEEALAMVGAALRSKNIRWEIDTKADPEILGFRNEYAQVVLNLLGNAQDAFLSRQVEKPVIRITVDADPAGRSRVKIRDNAGGVPEELFEKIFDPYFTTKHQAQGTGIGLYMSKMIIERNMEGNLTAANVEGGAEFTIVV